MSEPSRLQELYNRYKGRSDQDAHVVCELIAMLRSAPAQPSTDPCPHCGHWCAATCDGWKEAPAQPDERCPQCNSTERRQLGTNCQSKPFQPIYFKQYHRWHDEVPAQPAHVLGAFDIGVNAAKRIMGAQPAQTSGPTAEDIAQDAIEAIFLGQEVTGAVCAPTPKVKAEIINAIRAYAACQSKQGSEPVAEDVEASQKWYIEWIAEHRDASIFVMLAAYVSSQTAKHLSQGEQEWTLIGARQSVTPLDKELRTIILCACRRLAALRAELDTERLRNEKYRADMFKENERLQAQPDDVDTSGRGGDNYGSL